jgi:hypothetical protein
MEDTANSFHRRYNSQREATTFVTFDGALKKHSEWVDRSEKAMARVAGVWELVGLPFPLAEIREGF